MWSQCELYKQECRSGNIKNIVSMGPENMSGNFTSGDASDALDTIDTIDTNTMNNIKANTWNTQMQQNEKECFYFSSIFIIFSYIEKKSLWS